MLTAADPLPARPRRIAVAGAPGSGKSTLARRLGDVLGLPYTELDALHHGPAWTKRPDFEADIEALVRQDAWVCEWQYDHARPLLTSRVDLLVWVDLPFPVTLTRVVRRTVRRRLRREELWNGNQEGPLHTFFTDPEHIVRWSINSRNVCDERVPAVAEQRPDLPIVRLRTSREVDRWVREVVGPLAS